jgi:protein-serine/threonine kinase
MQFMLSASPVELTFDDDEWKLPSLACKAAGVGSWGVTSIGRGFDWSHDASLASLSKVLEAPKSEEMETDPDDGYRAVAHGRNRVFLDKTVTTTSLFIPSRSPSMDISPTACWPQTSHIPPLPSSPSLRPRRRSSQQRVSLIAGRVSIAPIDPPSPPPMLSENLKRTPSSGSTLSTRAPSPSSLHESFLGGRDISEFFIEGEIGRGAYGLVKRAREIQPDGSLGVSITRLSIVGLIL